MIMGLSDIFSITGSALSAESVRLNTTASNLANVDSVASKPEDVYQARYPVFKSTLLNAGEGLASGIDAMGFGQSQNLAGVQVSEITQSQLAPQVKHEPGHPLADENGNIYVSNINMVEQMTNMIEASRSYQTNIQVAETAKQLIQQTLRLGS